MSNNVMKVSKASYMVAMFLFVASFGNIIVPSPAYADEFACTPSNTAVFATRVHVKCVESVAGIQYFAAPTDDDAHVARILSVISTATVAGRPMFIFFDPSDTSGSAIGCQISDCRLIQGIGFWK